METCCQNDVVPWYDVEDDVILEPNVKFIQRSREGNGKLVIMLWVTWRGRYAISQGLDIPSDLALRIITQPRESHKTTSAFYQIVER